MTSETPTLSPQPAALDTQTLQELCRENLGPIYRFIYSRVGNREEAEDLTSQVFLKAVRKIDRDRSPGSMRSWLFQVARTTIADYWRARYGFSASSLDELMDAGWEGPVEDEPMTPDGKPAAQVQRILALLPERYREVLTCRFLFSLSVRETAQRMGLTEENVKVIQFRALRRAAALSDRQ